jgi:hypothetical protein
MCTKCASASLATVSEAADPVDAARAALDLGKRARVQPAEACDEWLVLTHAAAAALVTEATSFGMLVDRLVTLNEPMLQHCTECAACAEEALARTANFVSAIARTRDTRAAESEWVVRRAVVLCSLVSGLSRVSANPPTPPVLKAFDRLVASQIVLGANASASSRSRLSNALMPLACLMIVNGGCTSLEAGERLLKTLAFNRPSLGIVALVLVVQATPLVGCHRDAAPWFAAWWVRCWAWLVGDWTGGPHGDEEQKECMMCGLQKSAGVVASLLRRPYGPRFKALLRDCLDDLDHATICLNTSTGAI